MTTCLNCGSNRVAEVNAKCADRCRIELNEIERDDYPPNDMGIGRGKYIEFDYCLDCGHICGDWPLPQCQLEEQVQQEDEDY